MTNPHPARILILIRVLLDVRNERAREEATHDRRRECERESVFKKEGRATSGRQNDHQGISAKGGEHKNRHTLSMEDGENRGEERDGAPCPPAEACRGLSAAGSDGGRCVTARHHLPLPRCYLH